jgi:GNAT superfamily N-acetyltransferase
VAVFHHSIQMLTELVLDLLATLPAHQGRGIGSAILKWGTSKADAWGRRLYLEATVEGLPVYVKYGWRPVEEMILDRTRFGGQGKETYMIMIRDPIPQ